MRVEKRTTLPKGTNMLTGRRDHAGRPFKSILSAASLAAELE